jgi:WD40 repeat protein
MTHRKLEEKISDLSFKVFVNLAIFGLLIIVSACNPTIVTTTTNSSSTLKSATQPHSATAVTNQSLTPTFSFSTPQNGPVLKFKPWELVHDLAFSPDGKLLAVAAGDQVYIYNAATLEMKFDLSPGAWANRLAFHPTAPLIALANRDGSVQFWDTVKGTLICQFTAHRKGANSLAFHPDGTMLATTGTDITSRLWDISSAAAGSCNVPEIGKLLGESFSSPDVAFSPDGRSIAVVDLTNIRLRNSTNRKLIALLKGDLPIFDIAFSPDGRWLAAAEHHDTVALWDVSQPSNPVFSVLIPDVSKSKFHIWRVAFSPDSHLMAAGTSDGSINVWDISTMQLITTFQLPRAVTALAFSPDGRNLAAGGLDAQVWLFSAPK